MKRLNIFTTLSIILLGVVASVDASAQNTRRVEVSKAYSPEVNVATKLVAPTEISSSSAIDVDIEYDVRPDTWRTVLNAHDYKPVQATYWDFNRSTPFFVQVDAGYPLSSNAEVRYNMQSAKVGYLGVGFTHSGDYAARYSADGVKRSIGQSLSMHNGIDVSGALLVDKRILEASVAYDYDIFNRYAEVGEAACLNFHDANIGVRFGDNFANLKRLNFSVEANAGYWSHRLPTAVDNREGYGEFNVGASAKLARMFRKNRVDVALSYDMLRGGSIYGDMRMGIDVGYARRFKFVNLEVGIGYMYDKVSGRNRASHYVMPHAKALFDLKLDAFTPYVEVDTKVGQNGVASLYKRNPYLDFSHMYDGFTTMANDLSYNLSLGFNGNVNTRFAYRAYFGVNFVRDYLFFYVNHDGNFCADTANNTRLVYGAELEYMPIGGLRLGGSISGVIDNMSSLYLANDPAYEANIFAEYTLRRWKFGISSDFVGKRRWTRLDEYGSIIAPIEHKGYIDLGANVSFSVNNSIEVFVEGVNLLNAKIYDYANYYRSGIGFKVGVTIDF